MAGNYNVNTYNSALYNAGRDEVGAVAKSIIQAHTGPHIQAVVASDPSLPANQSGISFISDFNIIEGTDRKIPTSFYFPDLRARINTIRTAIKDVAAFLRALQKFDMPACVFPVAFLPDLQAFVFGLLEADLSASIEGKLAILDLAAILQIVQEDLGGQILGIASPEIGGRILGINAPTLGAIIWAPTNLSASLQTVQFGNLPAELFGFQFRDISAGVLSIAAPRLSALIKGFSAGESNLPSLLASRGEGVLSASLLASIPGPNDMVGNIGSLGSFVNLVALLRQASPGLKDLTATIGREIEQTLDLSAEISFLSAIFLRASLQAQARGQKDRFLNAFVQPAHLKDIVASISTNNNLKDLTASILATFGNKDLRAFIRAAETFVTAILTVSLYSTSNLRATIGVPGCEGGSASVLLSAIATAQQAHNLGGVILSFLEQDLGASINQKELFLAMDSIDIKFRPTGLKNNTFLVLDTIDVNFSPFRGLNLSAVIQAVLSNSDLSAAITARFPLPRVEPATNRLTAADLRLDHALDIQEVRIQMEGELLNYFYVNGTQNAFIQDSNQNWRINVRGFRPIADGLFGEFASARVCRLGNISSFSTLDEAMRSCIAAVIGQQGESEVSAYINGSGGNSLLPAQLFISDTFTDLNSLVDRVFPLDLRALIHPQGGMLGITAIVSPRAPAAVSIGASIDGIAEAGLSSTITSVS